MDVLQHLTNLKASNASLEESARLNRVRERRLLGELQKAQRQLSESLATRVKEQPRQRQQTGESLALLASRRQERVWSLQEENEGLRYELQLLRRSTAATHLLEIEAGRDEAELSFRRAAAEVRRLAATTLSLRKDLGAAKAAAASAAAGWVTTGDAVRDDLVRTQVQQNRFVRSVVAQAEPLRPRRKKRGKRRKKAPHAVATAAAAAAAHMAPSPTGMGEEEKTTTPASSARSSSARRREEIRTLREQALREERELTSLRKQAKHAAVLRRKAEAQLLAEERAGESSVARASKASARRERALASAASDEANARAESLARELKVERARTKRLEIEMRERERVAALDVLSRASASADDGPARPTTTTAMGTGSAPSQGGALRHVREKKKQREVDQRRREREREREEERAQRRREEAEERRVSNALRRREEAEERRAEKERKKAAVAARKQEQEAAKAQARRKKEERRRAGEAASASVAAAALERDSATILAEANAARIEALEAAAQHDAASRLQARHRGRSHRRRSRASSAAAKACETQARAHAEAQAYAEAKAAKVNARARAAAEARESHVAASRLQARHRGRSQRQRHGQRRAAASSKVPEDRAVRKSHSAASQLQARHRGRLERRRHGQRAAAKAEESKECAARQHRAASRVQAHQRRRVVQNQMRTAREVRDLYPTGSTVWCNYRGRGRFFEAHVTEENHVLGMRSVHYDGDGSEESNVTVDRIMERTETGTAVDARFAGRLRYFLATVTAARLIDGVEVLDLLYEDSDRETGVGWEYVRLRGEMLGGDDGTTPLAVGDQCEALFGGAEQWYGAVVAVAHDDGTYDLAYDDGDEELRVSRAYIRAAVVAVVVGQEQMQQGQQVLVQSQPSSSSSSSAFVIGSRVEANFGARGQWFPGTVQSVSDGGGFQLFSVLYDDGDVEDRVAVMDLREPSDAVAAAAAAVAVVGSHIVGDSVEGNFGGRGTYFHATISAVHDDDGTYDLKYADGDEEQRVDPSCIRISGDASAAAVAASGSYSVGDFVEGDFGGRGMHFRATISAVHEDDGTSYDLKYADGDEEQRVDPSFIRMFG